MKNILPQPVVVSNLPGATGLTGSAQVLNSRPDGYIFLWEHYSLALTPLISNAPFRWTDFDILLAGALSETVLIVGKDSPWNSVSDVVKSIKAEPGKYRFSVAMGGTPHFVYLQFAEAAGGFDTIVVPLSGDKARITSLLGGNSDISICALSAAIPYIKSGDLKALALANQERSVFLPDLVTLKELGYNVWYDYLYTVFLPKNVPIEVKQKLKDAFKKASEKPEVIAALRENVVIPKFLDTNEARNAWEKQAKEFERVMRKANLIKN
jgi:tripartite-type tricarboxylate transporter receptor subunit TctC